MKRLSLFWIFFALLLSNVVSAEIRGINHFPAVIDNQSRVIDLAEYTRYFTDNRGVLGFDRASRYYPSRYKRFDTPERFQNFGSTESTYWYTFYIKNPTDDPIRGLLELANPLVDEFEIHIVGEDGIEKRLYGNRRPYYEREIDSELLTVKLTLPAKKTQQLFIRLSSVNIDYFPLNLYLGNSYETKQIKYRVVFGVFVGIVFGLFGYNAFLYWSMGTPIYLYYLMLNFSTGFFMLMRNNLLYRFWPESYDFNLALFYTMSLLWVVTVVKFSQAYIETKVYYPAIHKLSNFFCIYTVFGVIMLVLQVDIKLFHSIYVLPVFIVIILFFYFSYVRLKEGYMPILFFVVGMTLMVMSSFVRVLFTVGILDNIQLMELVANSMDVMQLMVFSLGLANSIKHLSNEKLASEKRSISANIASAIKQEFINKMSFQIRTPLSDVIGGAELLAATDLKKNQEYCINVVKNSGQSLLTIVNDIIELLNSNKDDIRLELKPFNLAKHIDEYSSFFQAQIKQKHIDFQVELDRETPAEVVGDVTRIRQLLLNLLGNAFKFTEQGQVKLSIDCLDVNYKTGISEIKFTVSDTGVGISEANQKKLFQSYSQADLSITRKYGGTGLGLTICRRLVKLMNGDIGFESKEGEGSKFWFVLSLRHASVEDRFAVEQEALSGVSLSPDINISRVLIAEDDPSNQQVIRAMFLSLGIDCDVVNDGYDVISTYKKNISDYQLIILDSVMPRFDGIGAAHEIRRVAIALGQKKIPIITVSARAMPEDIARSQAAGIEGYVTKPFVLKDLVREIERVWRLPGDND